MPQSQTPHPPRRLQDALPTGLGVTGSSQALSSEDLLRGKTTVEIEHKGATYRLQATRLGKLILTK